MRRSPPLPQKLDVTLAYKAICLMPNLSATEKRVAAAILDHFNHKTGQCDPGFERLARLLTVSKRSIVRSIDRLVDLELIYRARFGGRSNRNSYAPNWARFREFEVRWKPWFAVASRPAAVQTLSPFQAADGRASSDSSVPQTSPNNNSNETSRHTSLSKVGRTNELVSTIHGSVQRGGKKASKSLVALHAAAERRVAADLLEHCKGDVDAFAAALEGIDPEMQAGATQAELRKRGAGALYILDCLANQLASQPDPAAVAHD